MPWIWLSSRLDVLSSRLDVVFARRPADNDIVDQAKRLGFNRREKLVALDRGRNHLERLPGMLNVDLVETGASRQDFAGLDLDIGGLALGAARGLMDHD